MTDERDARDVRLREEERAILLEPCDCGHTINDHGSIVECWVCEDEGDLCPAAFEALLVERVERIAAARVGEVVDCSRCGKPSSALGRPDDLPVCEGCAVQIGLELGRREVVERVEAACKKAEILTQESMGCVSQHWRGVDYADGLDAGIEVTADLVRDALRAAGALLRATEATP